MDNNLILIEIRDELCSWIDSTDLDSTRKILLKNIIHNLSDDDIIHFALDSILNEI